MKTSEILPKGFVEHAKAMTQMLLESSLGEAQRHAQRGRSAEYPGHTDLR